MMTIMMASFVSVPMLQHLLQVVGYPAIALFVFIECVGIPIPGETMLLFAAFYTATDPHLHISLVILSAAIGAIVGDNVGYYIGRTGGRAFVQKFGRFFFVKMEHLDQAERFFTRHGAKTVFFGRFISLLRIWSAMLAGMNRMPWRTFMLYNGLGGIAWALYVGVLGYIAGRYFHEHFDQIDLVVRSLGWFGLAVILLLALGTFVFIKMKLARRARNADNDQGDAVEGHQPVRETSKL
jgi:membrane protein DedA with SNARE-associated domain